MADGVPKRDTPFGLSWDAMKSFVICSSCSKWTSAPRRICEGDHVICHSCSGKTCPVAVNGTDECALPFVGTPMDIYTCVYNESTLPCPFVARGCPVQLFGREIDTHLAFECYFRAVDKCIVSRCGIRNINYDSYGYHLREDHEVPHVKEAKTNVLVAFGDEPFSKTGTAEVRVKCILTVECYGVKFAVFFGEYGERVVVWTAVFDEQIIGKNYRVGIKIHANDDSVVATRDIQFPVKTLRSCNVMEMDESEECLGINKSILQSNYLEPNHLGQQLCRVEVAIDDSE